MPPPLFFFFNDTATTEIYTLSLHDALPISESLAGREERAADEDEDDQQYNPEAEAPADQLLLHRQERLVDRKGTPLNSSDHRMSYALFCLEKKKGGRGAPGRAPATGRRRPR